MNFKFHIPTKVFFGRGELSKLHRRELPGKKALIVTSAGTSVKKYGYLDKLENELRLSDVSYVLFDKVLPNPIKAHVMEGAETARSEGKRLRLRDRTWRRKQHRHSQEHSGDGNQRRRLLGLHRRRLGKGHVRNL